MVALFEIACNSKPNFLKFKESLKNLDANNGSQWTSKNFKSLFLGFEDMYVISEHTVVTEEVT